MTAAIIIDGSVGFDATKEIFGLSAVRRLVALLKLADVKRVIIADSENMEKIMHYTSKIGADFLLMKKKDVKGAEGRVLAGIKYLPEKYSRLLIVPSSYPLIESDTVRLLCESEADITIPTCNGERGYPILVTRRMFDNLKDCGGALEIFLDENRERISEVETGDLGVVTDVSDETDVSELSAGLSLHTKLRAESKVTIAREMSFFGPGLLQLIQLVEETHAIIIARKIMGLAQSNLWHMTQAAERSLGFKLFVHENHGSQGGNTELTPECKRFAERYKVFEEDCNRSVEELFARHFPNGQ